MQLILACDIPCTLSGLLGAIHTTYNWWYLSRAYCCLIDFIVWLGVQKPASCMGARVHAQKEQWKCKRSSKNMDKEEKKVLIPMHLYELVRYWSSRPLTTNIELTRSPPNGVFRVCCDIGRILVRVIPTSKFAMTSQFIDSTPTNNDPTTTRQLQDNYTTTNRKRI